MKNIYTYLKNIKQKYFSDFDQITEMLFLVCLGIYLFKLTEYQSMFYVKYAELFEESLLSILTGAAIFRLLTGNWFRENRSMALLVSVLSGVYIRVYWQDKYMFLLFLAIFTVGAAGIDYRKILKTFVISVGTVVVLAAISSLDGVIPNLIYIKDAHIRSSMGINYPTDFASYVLCLAFAICILLRRSGHLVKIIVALIPVLVSYFIAYSKTSMYSGILFLGYEILSFIYEKIREKYPLTMIKRICNTGMQLMFPVLAVTVVSLIFMYISRNPIAVRADYLLSGRLKLAADAYELYGVKAFGTPFSMTGNGTSVFKLTEYNFIDCSYLLILIRYGWVLLVALSLAYSILTRKVIKAGYTDIAVVLAIVSVHSFSEHHFLDLNNNIWIIMLFSEFVQIKEAEFVFEWKTHRAGLIAAGGMTAGLLAYTPELFSMIRTLDMVNHVSDDSRGLILIALTVIVSGLIFGCIWFASTFTDYYWNYRKFNVISGLAAVLCFTGFAFLLNKGYSIVNHNLIYYSEMINSDEGALKIILENKSGKVVAGYLPKYYEDKFDLDKTIHIGEELAQYKNSTYITDNKKENNIFIRKGFCFSEISENSAVYTNDQAVIDALGEAGYAVNTFASMIHYVDLEESAERNKLYTNGDGQLVVNGRAHSLIYGPYANLYGGKYTASFDMNLSEKPEESTLIAKVKVSSYNGQKDIKTENVYSDQFDDSGRFVLRIPFAPGGFEPGVEFLVIAEGTQKIYLNEISYYRTPDNNERNLYDSKNRVIRTDYYTFEGKKAVLPAGYSSVEYEYDSFGNRNVVRYYDEDHNPVLISSGYAEVHRVFNVDRKIIREEYYGIDGNMAVLPGGYSALEKEYDEAGNAIVQRYYNADNNPVYINSGYCEVHRRFDENKRIIHEEYYDSNGILMYLPAGYAINEREYDEDGNVAVLRYYDRKNRPVIIKQGFAEVHREFNNDKRVIREEYFGITGKRIYLPDHYSALEKEYDDAGNAIIQRYYSIEDEPQIIKAGYAEIHRVFDSNRRIIREEYYDTESKLMVLPAGYSVNTRVYDESGNAVIQRYFDLNEEPVLIDKGYAEVHRVFDENKKVIREEYYNTDGRPMELIKGYASLEREYDSDGKVTKTVYFDLDGNEINIQ